VLIAEEYPMSLMSHSFSPSNNRNILITVIPKWSEESGIWEGSCANFCVWSEWPLPTARREWRPEICSKADAVKNRFFRSFRYS